MSSPRAVMEFLARQYVNDTSLSNSSTEYLCSEESAFGLLNDLLIDALGWMIHDNGAGFVINLRIDFGISDQVNDPFLAF